MESHKPPELPVNVNVLLVLAAFVTAGLIVAGVLLVLSFQRIETADAARVEEAPAGPRNIRRRQARSAAAAADRDGHEADDEVRNKPSFVE